MHLSSRETTINLSSILCKTTRHRCNLDVWALAQSRGDGHRSLVTPKRVLSEYNDLIF